MNYILDLVSTSAIDTTLMVDIRQDIVIETEIDEYKITREGNIAFSNYY